MLEIDAAQKLGAAEVEIALSTPIKAAAVARAREIYRLVATNGWDRALAEFRPERHLKPEATVGAFLGELAAKADLKPETLKGYVIAFRAILADIFEINTGNERFDYRSGGHARWLEKINSIRLADITPASGCQSRPCG